MSSKNEISAFFEAQTAEAPALLPYFIAFFSAACFFNEIIILNTLKT